MVKKKIEANEEESCECNDCQEIPEAIEELPLIEEKKKKSIVPAILIGIAVIAIILYILGII